jgi:predicted small metal-binding protein
VVKRINCVCGSVVEGDDDDELWERAQQHLSADHPDLAGNVAREDIVAQAEQI